MLKSNDFEVAKIVHKRIVDNNFLFFLILLLIKFTITCSKSSIEDVQAQNLICILDVDIQGVKNIKKTDLNPIYISIQPPSMEILVS